ncbi:MAG: hypothetical protein AB1414_01520 [bacterium]
MRIIDLMNKGLRRRSMVIDIKITFRVRIIDLMNKGLRQGKRDSGPGTRGSGGKEGKLNRLIQSLKKH